MEEKRKKRCKTFRKQIPNSVSPAFSVIIINANGLNISTKKPRLIQQIKKTMIQPHAQIEIHHEIKGKSKKKRCTM